MYKVKDFQTIHILEFYKTQGKLSKHCPLVTVRVANSSPSD